MEIHLKYNTDLAWVKTVLHDFDAFLQDHADCERKASAMAMSFVAKCPDKKAIIPELIETALEELVHFKMVYELMEARGIGLKKEMSEDIYIKKLIEACRSGRDDRLMDRMLVAGIVETRGAERFKMVADHIEDAKLKKFYTTLYESEAKHGDIFVKLAANYWPLKAIENRIEELLYIEADICKNLPLKAALH